MKSWLIVIAVTGLLIGSAATPQDQIAAQHFVRGKKLIEHNGADSMGSTQQGFEEGIAEVRKAIELGYSDRAAAYKLLANAYNTLALFYAKPDSEEQREALLLRRDALEKLLELRPDDPRIRAEYASVIEDKEMGLAAWRDVVAEEPNDAEARLTLGVHLVQRGQIDEGMSHLRKMVELADLYRGQFYVDSAQRALNEKGKKVEAEEIRRLAQRRIAPYLLPNRTIANLGKLQPGEGRMRAELAKVVKDPTNQSGQLQNILAGNALHTRAMFSLGMVYVFDRQYEVGVMYLKRLFESAALWRIQGYAKIAEKFLIEEGRKSDAAEIAKLIANKRPKPN